MWSIRTAIRFITPVLFLWTTPTGVRAGDSSFKDQAKAPEVATFSIVARNPDTGELGIAVASKVPAVGAIVPYAVSEVGAIATQASANPAYGPEGLKLLKEGKSPQQAIDILTSGDRMAARRQLGIVSADGTSATFTGKVCTAHANGISGENFAIQGNILASEDVLTAMAEAFKTAPGDFGQRLIACLAAAEAAGGDRRGKQSAALIIVRKGWGYGGMNDRYRDIRVDDHEDPVAELARVYEAHKKIFRPRRVLQVDPVPEEPVGKDSD